MYTSLKTFTFFIFLHLIVCSPSKNVEMELEKVLNILEPRNLLEIYSSENEFKKENTSSCLRDISLTINQIMVELSGKVNSMWALKMLDASTKIPSGVLTGNLVDLGMYDECISVSGIIVNETEIRGRHCLYSFKLTKIPLAVTFSICVPSSCKAQDLKYIFEIIKKEVNETDGLENWISDDFSATCSSVGDRKISVGTIITIVILVTIVLFLTICTIVQLFETKIKFLSKYGEILAKFSLYRSTRRILNTEINASSFPALHGIRTLSIFWVVLGHSYTSRIFTPFINSIEKYKWFSTWNCLYIFLSPFAVDTFFMISGFLMTYLFLKEAAHGKKFNIFMYYLHRYIRLTPVVLILLLITLFIIPHLGSGPIWEKALESTLTRTCEEKWWTLLLYIQNYVRTDIECLGHTWYLAADMHFYWLSPIILLPLAKKPKLGLTILSSFFIASLTIVGTIIAVNGYVSTLYSHSISMNLVKESFRFFYTVSHTRASSWLVGIYLGYTVNSSPGNLSKKSVYMGWIGALSCFIFCTLGQRIALEDTYTYSQIFETSFGMFSRPIWAIGVAWIIFASIYGYGGLVTKFLSLPVFVPLSRISYCIYVVHATLQIAKVNTMRTADYFAEFQFFNCFLSELLLTIVVAFFFSIFFESPIMVLEKMIFRRKKENFLPGCHLRDAEKDCQNPTAKNGKS